MFESERLKLAPLKREYIESFLKWLNDPEITQYLTGYRPLTQDMEEDWFDNLKKRENAIIFSILLKDNQKLIGNCGIEDIHWVNRSATCGLFIGDKENQGKGYGPEALRLLLDYGFSTLNLNRIDLKVYEFNTRAIKCYKKVGFIEEGRKRQATFKNGKYYDDIVMSILHEEWKGKS
ncbi:MAG: GNAT family N-acetyltransferase [Candidatus Hodarchaeota archaeon]